MARAHASSHRRQSNMSCSFCGRVDPDATVLLSDCWVYQACVECLLHCSQVAFRVYQRLLSDGLLYRPVFSGQRACCLCGSRADLEGLFSGGEDPKVCPECLVTFCLAVHGVPGANDRSPRVSPIGFRGHHSKGGYDAPHRQHKSARSRRRAEASKGSLAGVPDHA